jgi:hypothetical protein
MPEPVEVVRAKLRAYAKEYGYRFEPVNNDKPQGWAIVDAHGNAKTKAQGLRAWREEVRRAGGINALNLLEDS